MNDAAAPLTAWIIEALDPFGVTLYYSHDGDWCSNSNHAHKFPTPDEASVKMATIPIRWQCWVQKHQWVETL